MLCLDEVITDGTALLYHYIMRDGYCFTSITHPANVYDAIEVYNPHNVIWNSRRGSHSQRSIDEEIELINKYKLEKARIIGENIDFITQCPSLKHLWISPAGNIGNDFDYSPVYRMPQIKSLMYDTTYMV